MKDSEDSGLGIDISADGDSLPDHRVTANMASGIPIRTATPERTAAFSEHSTFDNSGSPSMTPNRQARNQKEKLRTERPVPHKENVASLDVDAVEDCPALSSTSFSVRASKILRGAKGSTSSAHEGIPGEVPVPHEENVGSFEHHDVEKGPAPCSTSDPRRKSNIPRGAKRSTSPAKEKEKITSISINFACLSHSAAFQPNARNRARTL
jgi:hypothetical protein